MTIGDKILIALADGPLTASELQAITGDKPNSIAAACAHLRMTGALVCSMMGKGYRPKHALAEHADRLDKGEIAQTPGQMLANHPRVDRDPCPRCATRRDIGCRHYPLERLAA